MEAEGRKVTFSRGSRRLHLFKRNSEETVALQMAFLQQLQRQISPARGHRQPCLQLHLHASRDARRGHSSLCRVETYHCPLPSALRGSETEKEFHKDRRMPHTGWTSYCMAWTLIPHGLLLSETIHGEPFPPIFQGQTKSSAHTGTWICYGNNDFWVPDQHCCLPLLLHTCNYPTKLLSS